MPACGCCALSQAKEGLLCRTHRDKTGPISPWSDGVSPSARCHSTPVSNILHQLRMHSIVVPRGQKYNGVIVGSDVLAGYMRTPHTIRTIDSHTEGEPTRVVISGGPDLGSGSIADRLTRMRTLFDGFRSGVVNEPRGSDAIVGGLLTEPTDTSCAAAIIFFNNVGYLGMCGHGTMGAAATLRYLGRIGAGKHLIETAVGNVAIDVHDCGAVSVENVPSFRFRKALSVDIDGAEPVVGDVAWGGNWFFLADTPLELSVSNIESLTEYAWRIRRALERRGITGQNGAAIDHVELFSKSDKPGVNGKSFVLCPGKAYDRSPCGTGLSAKLACLYADGKLEEGAVWIQESILGTTFQASFRLIGDRLIPTITGRAYITADTTLIFDPNDPFAWGIR